MLKKIDSILFNLLNLAVLVFWFYCALQVPESPVAPLIFLTTFAVVLYIILDVIRRICNIFEEREIQRYIDSGFNPRSIRR